MDFGSEVREVPKTFRDALGVSVSALCFGREGQDLGLPLLHVLGKFMTWVWVSGHWRRKDCISCSEDRRMCSPMIG